MTQNRTRSSGARRGAIAAQAAVALLALMGVTAVALEGGILQAERRRAQSIADTSALAAAASLWKHAKTDGDSWSGGDTNSEGRDSANAIAAANGYIDSNSTRTITFNPGTFQAGPHIGKQIPMGQVEVIVQYNQRRYFSAIFGSGTLPVRARAVARGLLGEFDASILLLSENASPAFNINGNANVTDPGKIVVNSVSSNAFHVNGRSGSVVAGEIDVVGGITGTTSNISAPTLGSKDNVFAGPGNTQAHMDDPLGVNGINLAPPSSFGLVTRSNSQYSAAKDEVLQPGIYVGGILVKTSGVQMASGIYYIMDGEVRIQTNNGSLSSQAGGVLIYLTNNNGSDSYATFNLQGNATVNLHPMTAGPYAGMTIFQDRSAPVDNQLTIQGGSTSNLTGMVYAPQAQILISGGNVASGDAFIANTMNFDGNNTLTIPKPKIPVKASRVFGLVE